MIEGHRKEKKLRDLLLLASGLALALSSQGCSLLFVAKGATRYVEEQGTKTPPAASQSTQMSRAVVLHYKVREGDTLQSIALLYYGKETQAAKVARANGLDPSARPKTRSTLRIEDPLHFPGPRELVEKKIVKGTALQSPTPTHKPGPVSHLDLTTERITKVPRPKVNRSFGPGEKLKFEVRALSMLGGFGILEVGNPVSVSGRPCFPLIARARTAFPFSLIFQVEDVQTSFFDPVDLITWKFQNNVLEGKHKAQNLELYDQIRHRVVRATHDRPPEEMDVAPYTQDIISCFYYFRLLPMKVGETYSIPVHADGRNYNLIVEVIKKERVAIASGSYDCLLVKPHVRYATIFRNTDDINIWLTDDDRRLPVLVRSKIIIGNVEASLVDAALTKRGKPGEKEGP